MKKSFINHKSPNIFKYKSKAKNLSKKVKGLLAAILSASTLSAAPIAFAGGDCCPPQPPCAPMNNWCLAPYFGIDAGRNIFRWYNDFGGNLFQRHVAMANIYLGAQLCDFLGLEVGFDKTNYYRDTVNMTGLTESFLGGILAQVTTPPTNFLTNVQGKGWHVDLTGFVPIIPCRPEIQLIGQIGLMHLKMTHEVQTIADSTGPFNITTARRYFDDRKWIPRVNIGLQYMVCDNVGFRAFFGWQQTNRFRNLQAKVFPPTAFIKGTVSMKNSFRETIGMFIRF